MNHTFWGTLDLILLCWLLVIKTCKQVLSSRTALVLGAKGQDGALICKSLLQKNYEVIGLSKQNSSPSLSLKRLGIENEIDLKMGDIKNMYTELSHPVIMKALHAVDNKNLQSQFTTPQPKINSDKIWKTWCVCRKNPTIRRNTAHV